VRAAILTVSTSLAAGNGEDRSGPTLAEQARANGAEIVAQDVVADDASEVAGWLAARVREGIELVLTTGGTGFTTDDVTPEATRAVIEREAPGIAEAMRAEAIRYTPMGMLSRGVAGIADRTLIINFPGSPRAIAELFVVVAPVLEHAVATLHREPGDRTAGH
jgi:molybdenum cofactor synthesis domain-containing protein